MMMMMIGDHPRTNPNVQIPQHPYDDPTAHDPALAALQRYLPSNRNDAVFDDDSDGVISDFDVPVDAYSCDDFRMYEFKVRKCARVRPHDWTECPYAHPGEKARRRDPRRYHYLGTSCPDFRRGACPRGEGCEYAHGVFECWLHPARYRTQPCKDGTHCRRRVCFFAHAPEQLRVLPFGSSNNGAVATSPDGSPGRPVALDLYGGSPPSSPPTTGLSPPMTTGSSPPMSLNSIGHLTASMRSLQLNQMKMGMGVSVSSPIGSPRSPFLRPGFLSLPSTPIRPLVRSGLSAFDAWDNISGDEEPLRERVESGRELRERIYSKLGKENSLDRARGEPDVGWVTELLNS